MGNEQLTMNNEQWMLTKGECNRFSTPICQQTSLLVTHYLSKTSQ
jgi:hypothetical protein